MILDADDDFDGEFKAAKAAKLKTYLDKIKAKVETGGASPTDVTRIEE
jgi:hypothetical protein